MFNIDYIPHTYVIYCRIIFLLCTEFVMGLALGIFIQSSLLYDRLISLEPAQICDILKGEQVISDSGMVWWCILCYCVLQL